MRAKEYLARPYARRLVPDETGGYIATIQEFPGCVAEGETAEQALGNLEAAAESWIEAQLELNQPISDPIAFDGYSGKIALRIPRTLHRQVAELAASEGASINQVLTAAVATYVGAKTAIQHMAQSIVEFHSRQSGVSFYWNISHFELNMPIQKVQVTRELQGISGFTLPTISRRQIVRTQQ